MGAVIVIVAIWLLIMFDEPHLHVRLGAASMALGYILAWYIPLRIKRRHVKSQNRLLDRCRALLIVGSRALEAGSTLAAEQVLSRIRKLENLWRLGNSIPFRCGLALWAIAWGVAASVAIRFLGILVVHYGWTGTALAADKVPSELMLAAMISITAPLIALAGWFEAWANPWAIENCGDRLRRFIDSPRGVEPLLEGAGSNVPSFDGMTPYEMFGLGPHFTRRELDRARRRLAQELHPDRHSQANAREREDRENAMKRVNAAYDALRAKAN